MESDVVIVFVILAVFVAIAWAIAQGIKGIANRHPAAAPQKHRVSGVGGWLLFLILGLMVLGPLMGAGGINSDFTSVEGQYPSLTAVTEWNAFKSATWWTFLFFSCVSFYGGLGLVKDRTLSAVKRAKVVLWVIGPLATLVMGLLLPVLIFGKFQVGPQFVGRIAGSVIVAGIWTLYLSKSKRVRATYGNPATTATAVGTGSAVSIEPSDNASDSGDRFGVVLGIAAFLAFLVLGLAQLVAGFAGIEHGLGVWWAYGALAAALLFRFTLPITIGSFFGAMNVWGWHWALAALFAAPGLVLVIPGVLASILSVVKRS